VVWIVAAQVGDAELLTDLGGLYIQPKDVIPTI
jgi:hypothetical protein